MSLGASKGDRSVGPPRTVGARSPRAAEVRRLAVANRQVAEAIALVDHNGLDYTEALECLVLELCAAPTLPNRDDDGACLACAEVDCQCRPGGVA